MIVSAVDYLLHQGVWDYAQSEVLDRAPWSPKYASYFDEPVAGASNRRTLVKLAHSSMTLLNHKQKHWMRERMRFLGHSEEGAEIAPIFWKAQI